MTFQTPFVTIEIDWKLLLGSLAMLLLLPIVTNLLSSQLLDLFGYWSGRLIRWAVSIQPPATREIREEEWLGVLDETPGKSLKLCRAMVIAMHAPLVRRGARGLPLLRDEISETIRRLLRRFAAGLVRRKSQRRSAAHRGRAQNGRQILMLLARRAEFADAARLFTVVGMFSLGLGSAYLGIGRRGFLDFDGEQPSIVLAGWGVMRDTLNLGGYQSIALSIGVAAFIMGTGLAIYTRGYTYAPLWANVASVGVGLLGVVAIVPLILFLVLLLINIVLWLLVILVAILFAILLISVAFAGFSTSGPPMERSTK